MEKGEITRLCLIRHGETDWNAQLRIQGHRDMPLNANGKLNRLALPDVAQSGDIAQFINGSEQPYVAARNGVEAQLITILADVLSVDAGKLGVQHSFFDLGGQSLLAVQLLTQLRRSFGVELPLRSIFEHTTVEALANLVIEAQLATVDEALLVQLLDEVEKIA